MSSLTSPQLGSLGISVSKTLQNDRRLSKSCIYTQTQHMRMYMYTQAIYSQSKAAHQTVVVDCTDTCM